MLEEKKFIIELVESMIVSLIVVPATIIGMCAGGLIWGDKLEPWLKKKLGIKSASAIRNSNYEEE